MGLLVIQTPDGVTIASADVPADQVIGVLKSWVQILAPGATLILDGVVLSESDKRRLVPHHSTPQPAEVRNVNSNAQIQEFARSLHDAFELIRQGEWELLRHTQQRTREMADEAVRQRALLHRCLQDCDAVDRSILATATTDRFASRIAVASSGPRRLNAHDVLRGVQKILTGRKQ
jgi:hypothetical protein